MPPYESCVHESGVEWRYTRKMSTGAVYVDMYAWSILVLPHIYGTRHMTPQSHIKADVLNITFEKAKLLGKIRV